MGIVTKFDFLQAFAFTTSQIVPHFDELMRRTVADVMMEAVIHVEPTAPLTRVLQLMVGLKSRSFPVVSSDGQLLGMISREDIMRALKESTGKLNKPQSGDHGDPVSGERVEVLHCDAVAREASDNQAAKLRTIVSATVASEISLTIWLVRAEPPRAIRNIRMIGTEVALPHRSAIELDVQSIRRIDRALMQCLHPDSSGWRPQSNQA